MVSNNQAQDPVIYLNLVKSYGRSATIIRVQIACTSQLFGRLAEIRSHGSLVAARQTASC